VKDQATEAAIAATAQKVTYGASAATVYGGLTANEIAAFGGLVLALLGFFVNLYYKRRIDRRDAELHAKMMAQSADE